MNKAFVREPDGVSEHCPRCGSLGLAVGSATLDARVRSDARGLVGETAAFCPYGTCPVAYFDAFERVVTVDQLMRPVFPKDPAAPVCACFGLTVEEIEEEARAGSVERVRSVVARAKSAEARCVTQSASGRPCVPDVQRCYFQAAQRK